MIEKQVSQLNTQSDLLKDFNEKIDSFKATQDSNSKERQVKEIMLYIANKISQALNANDIYTLQDLFTDKFVLLSEVIKNFDWPALDKKTLETLNNKVTFYYEFMRNRHQFGRKKFSHEGLKDIFEKYRGFLQKIGDNEIAELPPLSPSIIFKLLEDYLECYYKLMISCENNENLLNEDQEDFWEMFHHISDGISLPSKENLPELIKSISQDSAENKIETLKNCSIISSLSLTFKSKIVESNVYNNKEEDIIKFILDNTFNGRIKEMKSYYEVMKKTHPILYYELLIENVILSIISKNELSVEDLKQNLIELLQCWEFMNTHKKFLRKPYEANLIKFKFTETMKSLIVMHIVSIFKNTDSNELAVIFDYIGLNHKEMSISSNFTILNDLSLPFINDWNMKLGNYINKKILRNCKVIIDVKQENELKLFKKQLVNTILEN